MTVSTADRCGSDPEFAARRELRLLKFSVTSGVKMHQRIGTAAMNTGLGWNELKENGISKGYRGLI